MARDPSKVKPVTDWLSNSPSTTSELKTFLGFVGYYHSIVQNFSAIAQPLYQLLGGRTGNKKTLPQWQWTYDCQKAFELLISKLTQPLILAYPDFAESFIIHIDVSGSGATLYQTQDGKQIVITYGSRTLNAAERNYCAYRREFLALKWSVTEKFDDYLYGRRFHILTDNNPLAHVITAPKLNPTDHRWLASLSPYDFTITYRAGKSNADADGLSRLPVMNRQADFHEDADATCVRPFLHRWRPLAESQTTCFCSSRSFEAIVQCHQVMVPAVEVIPASEAAVEDMLEPAIDVRSSNGRFPSISAAEWPMLQNDDPHICRVVGILRGSQQWPVNLYVESVEVRQMLQERRTTFSTVFLFSTLQIEG